VTRICIAYYSRTGKTEKLCTELAKALKGKGLDAQLYRIKPERDYAQPLYANPRLAMDTLLERSVRINVEPHIDIENCHVIVIAGPVWFGRPAPPLLSFIRRHLDKHREGIVLALVSRFGRGYAERFSRKIGLERAMAIDIVESELLKGVELLTRSILSLVTRGEGVGQHH